MRTQFRFMLIVPCLLGLVSIAYAQNGTFSIGPRVGVNFANVSNIDDTDARTGMVLGVTSTYSISESFGITGEILYSQEGYKFNGDDEVHLDYLQIPIYFNVFFSELGEAFRPKVYAGVSPGFLITAENNGNDVKDVFQGFQFNLLGGLGFNYRLADRVWLNADLRSFWGLSDIREDSFQTDESISSRNLQVSAGVAFGLSKID